MKPIEINTNMNWRLSTFTVIALATLISGCSGERSGATGWAYNSSQNGGFERQPFFEQETAPGLVFIEGGTFTMGQVEEDLSMEWDNIPRRVTVSSFYMDETEVTNSFWLEYLFWLQRVYGDSYPEVVDRALPDTLVWREKLSFNEPFVDYYLRHPAYRDYPVVGISWTQANNFCKWRSDRVNEQLLVREGLIAHNPDGQMDEDHFTTAAYMNGQYQGEPVAEGLTDYRPNSSGYRNVKFEDGLFQPAYRLPTEAEWEFAALGLIGNSYAELITDRRTYPWDGHYTRDDNSRSGSYGSMNANFSRGRGDYMGVAGNLNDGAAATTAVYQYAPNDYGLYNMAGNVNEWVMDVYRPYNSVDAEEFRPFRGNVFQTTELNSEGVVADKIDYVIYDVSGLESDLRNYQNAAAKNFIDEEANLVENIFSSLQAAKDESKLKNREEAMEMLAEAKEIIVDSELLIAPDLLDIFVDNIQSAPGELVKRNMTVEESLGRDNYREADNIDYKDGDFQSSIYYGDDGFKQEGNRMYGYGKTSLINNQSRVYKGGGWNDRSYYLSPGTRRFLDENKSSAAIGFRCAMDRMGSQTMNSPR
ncbi:MAG: gliding motility lipoprotein GldJ [Crocinitomicaceae bacterium]|nr:gliding motility lipoprotein GldJ [Crocinitomicaceae bacterium]|tara:strand:- start:36 stop:1799 length:1764 start_codon:yes stop_codon:yes gene_type:complete